MIETTQQREIIDQLVSTSVSFVVRSNRDGDLVKIPLWLRNKLRTAHFWYNRHVSRRVPAKIICLMLKLWCSVRNHKRANCWVPLWSDAWVAFLELSLEESSMTRDTHFSRCQKDTQKMLWTDVARSLCNRKHGLCCRCQNLELHAMMIDAPTTWYSAIDSQMITASTYMALCVDPEAPSLNPKIVLKKR